MSLSKRRRLTLSDLVDMELQLTKDRQADLAAIRHRDAAIGRSLVQRGIDPRESAGPSLFLAWIDELRARDKIAGDVSPGQQTTRFLAGMSLVLLLTGAALGVAAVAAWLVYTEGRPINVIFFFASILGLQLPLLMLWGVAAIPSAWIARVPGMPTIQWLLRGIGQLPPRVIAWAAGRISRETHDLVARVRGELTRWNWIYGRLQFWLLVRLTQVFAVAFNLGAVAAFLIFSYGSDPAFGWKSTLMTPEQLHRATRVVAAPWSFLTMDWADEPTLDNIRATRYWSLDDRFRHRRGENPSGSAHGADPWAHWWPFLFASLICYGLLPRLVTFCISSYQVRRGLASIQLDHSEFLRLADRLRRLEVDTQAPLPESAAESENLATYATRRPNGASSTPAGPCAVLGWAGVGIPATQLEGLVAARLCASIRGVEAVGDLDPAADKSALASAGRQVRDGSVAQVAVVVEAWEPPVGDYLDFLGALRQSVGSARPIRVLLYDRRPNGQPMPPRSGALKIWQDRLATLGDPWLTVDSLIESPASATGRDTASSSSPARQGDQP